MRSESIKTRRGFTTVELMTMTGLMALGTFLLFQTALYTSRSVAKVDTKVSSMEEARAGFEQIGADIKMADRILAAYPPTGRPVVRSLHRDEVVMRIPNADAQGEIIPNSWTVVAYRKLNGRNRLNAQGETSVPVRIERLTAQINGNSFGRLSRDRFLLNDAVAFKLNYYGIDSFEGDHWRRDFNFEGSVHPAVPLSSVQININGSNWNGVGATVTRTGVSFARPLQWAVLMDAQYEIDGTAATTADGGNASDLIVVYLKTANRITNARNNNVTNNQHFSSRFRMLNR